MEDLPTKIMYTVTNSEPWPVTIEVQDQFSRDFYFYFGSEAKLERIRETVELEANETKELVYYMFPD